MTSPSIDITSNNDDRKFEDVCSNDYRAHNDNSKVNRLNIKQMIIVSTGEGSTIKSEDSELVIASID